MEEKHSRTFYPPRPHTPHEPIWPPMPYHPMPYYFFPSNPYYLNNFAPPSPNLQPPLQETKPPIAECISISSNSEKEPEVFVRKEEDPQPQEKSEIKICHCSRSHCLKEYCVCYKSGQPCGSQCKCGDCKNSEPRLNQRPIKRRRNPNTCNCTRSKCSKKYCECFAAGRTCSEECACKDCENWSRLTRLFFWSFNTIQ